ncbi:MAG: Ribosomal protein S23 [Candidatus Jorgensenbacteria bacterium GW2011_GWA1_48_11]|uniref:Ribosomal protein S23 n=1 Tax=Candidatus Jorgensenbacteria bacterium GW2011_GWA1_48_11 TaxID=1618660 RepID=A0A0G1XBP0_9BACT|nr:MAG: Ribosomal protein S23 [Candidatus Jorgensenbacteria bacterium GW2011_GWA1_48_11]KKW12206.1 MAG: Ribosomal protein S23 [Candidatus Jorgensenbacteria bacterium GW2011_GWB1_49_9]
MELVKQIYKLTENFPSSEAYGLSSQMRRAAVSMPSNIAEGSRRSSKKDFRNFLFNAFGSGAELETQVELVRSLSFGEKLNYQKVDNLLSEVMKMLNTMIFKSNL